MPEIKLQVEGGLPLTKWEQEKAIHLDPDSPLLVSAMPGGMNSGRCAVAVGVWLPHGRWVIGYTSLRALYSATKALVTRHGEDFMLDEWGLRLGADRERKLALGMQAVLLQLADAKKRLGEPLQLDTTEADAEYDRIRRIEEAARRLDALIGEFGMAHPEHLAEAAQALHDALRAGPEGTL